MNFRLRVFAYVTIPFVVGSMACSHLENSDSNDHRFFKVEGDLIAMDTTRGALLDPRQMLLIDDTLLVVHNWPGCLSPITIADVKNKRIVGHFGRQDTFGFEGVSLHKSKHKRRIEAAGFGSAKIIDVDILLTNTKIFSVDLLNITNNEFLRTDFTDESVQITSLWNINDTLFQADGLFPSNKRLGLCDNRGEIISTHFTYPDTDSMVSSKIKSTAFASLFRNHPKKNLFAKTYFESDWLEILALKNNELVSVFNHFTYLPKYKVVDDIIAQSSFSNIQGNFAIDVTEKFIYVLRSSRTIQESLINGKLSWHSNALYVYTWTGELFSQLKLDQQVGGICVNDSDETLIAFIKNENEKTPKLLKYKLPRFFQ